MSYKNASVSPNKWAIPKLTPSQVFGRMAQWMFKAHGLKDIHEKPIRVTLTQSNEGEIILSNDEWLFKFVNLLNG